MDCNPPGSSVHGIFQARVLEWIAISFSRGSFCPRDQTHISCVAGRFFTAEPLRKPTVDYYSAIKKNEIMPFAVTWVGLEILILSEVSHTDTDKYHTISLICRIKEKDTNELIYKTETDSQT